MQDKALINISQATKGKYGVYSLEFHETQNYTHVKRVNSDGSETLFSIGGSGGPTSSSYIENLELTNNGLTLNSTGIGDAFNNTLDVTSLRLGMVTSGNLNGNSPATVYTGGSTPADNGHVAGDWVIDMNTSNIWYLANANTNIWVQSQPSGGSSSKTYEYWENTISGTQSVTANQATVLENDGLGANTSAGAGTLFDGSLFDFSSLPVGSVVSITLQTSLQPTTQHSHDFTIYFNHQTDNGNKQFSFVTDETRTQGRPITHTITIPILDTGMQSGGASFSILSTGDLTVYNNFVSISVL